jgi:DNA invertase Pin-like site-specific DNA recombinase
VIVRVASYIRVARVEGRRMTNLDRQAARLAGTVAGWPGCLHVAGYVDVGSGRRLDRRGLGRLLADAAARRFDVLVVEDWDRLARDPAGQRWLGSQLETSGVTVWPLHRVQRRRCAERWLAVAVADFLDG